MSSVPPSDDRLVADTYRILAKCDETGQVLKAHDRRFRRIVALKILPPRIVRDPSALEAFLREIPGASRLKHPNLASLFGAGEDRGLRFLVMEYAEGIPLDRVVRDRGPLSLDQALDIVTQAARGLQAAHAQGIVHRGLKPSRLMLDAASTVRVLGLGQGRIHAATGPLDEAADLRAADYMAPEQAEDAGRPDPRGDIYSLGGILYFLLTGREPFVGETLRDRLAAHRDRPAPRLQVLRPDVPSTLDETYRKMMAKRPEDRPASMTEVLARLEACRAVVPSSSPVRSVPRTGGETAKTPIGPEFDLDGLGIEGRSKADAVDPRGKSAEGAIRPRLGDGKHRAAADRSFARRLPRSAVILGLAAIAVVAAVAWSLAFRRGDDGSRSDERRSPGGDGNLVDAGKIGRKADDNPRPPPPREWVSRTIFDGKDPRDWMLTSKRPLPRRHVQPDGLNPHGTGSYLVVYEHKLGDFILDFDYKLSPGCNTGVFLRVGDLDDPVNTGLEVSLQDSSGEANEATGAIYGLVPPSANAQKPVGHWNHMTITAQGPMVAVSLNGTGVSRINLDEWNVPRRRTDNVTYAQPNKVPRIGYLGFQDLIGDCWFKNIVVQTPVIP